MPSSIGNGYYALCLAILLCRLESSSVVASVIADKHASPSELARLFDLELRVMNKIAPPVENRELANKLIALRDDFEAFRAVPTDELIGHPVNLLLLYSHWEDCGNALRLNMKSATHKGDAAEEAFVAALPGPREVKDIAMALLRLQTVYALSPEDVSAGAVRSHRGLRGLDKDECFLVAKTAFENLMREEYLQWHAICMAKVDYAAEAAALAKQFDANVERIDSFYSELRKSPQQSQVLEKLHQQLPGDLISKMVSGGKGANATAGLFGMYRQLCQSRAESLSVIPAEEKCIHFAGGAFGRLAPFKLEYHAYDPLVVTAHDVLDAALIERVIRDVSVPGVGSGLQEPRSVSGTSGEVGQSGARAGKVGFLPAQPPALARLAGRLTGLSMEFAEALQLVSYGVGGHYEPHVDFFSITRDSAAAFASSSGDRIATLLFYLSDVAEGGGTVFPALGLAVRPERGSALFWYNLHKNGTGDAFTLHAGCPVLVGSKWVANQWFRQHGQEFLRPCDVDREL